MTWAEITEWVLSLMYKALVVEEGIWRVCSSVEAMGWKMRPSMPMRMRWTKAER